MRSRWGGKWLEILKEISPQLSRVIVVYNPKTAPYADLLLRSITEAAPTFAVEAIGAPVQDADEDARSIDAFAHKPNAGLLILPDASTLVYRDVIIARATLGAAAVGSVSYLNIVSTIGPPSRGFSSVSNASASGTGSKHKAEGDSGGSLIRVVISGSEQRLRALVTPRRPHVCG
jgi:hypothetical protein